MPHSPMRRWLPATLLICCYLNYVPARAETLEELDALSDQSTDPEAGIALAREQANRGEYLEALATLERLLAVHPKSHEARLIHAVYLCEIDDLRGGLAELGKLKKKHYGEELLAEARAMCEPDEEG